ncbi:carbohydrate ABC transporter permease [Halalkalibacter alkaliphilus]|uniref:Sugar ABC transporter permease n=1 Tax=Halalkalibacter alkaliphilus TaxID=2917993 RepID=A0A9X2CX69_9BACI|nr:sugar ABC transporter permease [Halalkalibacter alkaliphilus]MCL7749928.1 sugar ABC transporter permease [Halalkalibacter alkaliphilus]
MHPEKSLKINNTPPVNKPTKKNKITKLFYSPKFAPYLFVFPFIAGFLIFFLYPIISTIIMSFQDVKIASSEYVGIDNYQRLNNQRFFTAITNSAQFTFWTILVLIPIPLMLAVFLNSKLTLFKNLFKSALFIPALTSVVVGGVIFRIIFAEADTGFINSIITSIGFSPQEWRMQGNTAMFLMVALACWRWMGVNILYFLAALQNIPKDLYESAEIDGAGALQKFKNITLPFLKPISIYVLTITIYSGFSMFTESYVFWRTGSPNDIGLTIVGYLFQEGFSYGNLGFGSAVGITLLGIVLIVNIIQLKAFGLFKKED